MNARIREASAWRHVESGSHRHLIAIPIASNGHRSISMDAQKLRGLPHEPELFCKRTAAEQNRFSVKDQNPDYEVRELPTHETTTMALNVLAAAHGRGFFLHLPSKSSLTSFPSAERLPAQRRIAQSG